MLLNHEYLTVQDTETVAAAVSGAPPGPEPLDLTGARAQRQPDPDFARAQADRVRHGSRNRRRGIHSWASTVSTAASAFVEAA
jgi:hypothetical protein